jgi:N-acetylmuramic acid 6-phosphate etherase
MTPRARFASLTTERPNPRARDLDRLAPEAIARLMNREDARAVAAVRRESRRIAAAVDTIVGALGDGGRLFFVGAGTSGRLGVIEAAECPPTFGTRPSLVQAIMAGGRGAVFRSREGAEDDAGAARTITRRRVRAGDVVVGVSASSVTPFVHAALEEARESGAATILVTCNPPGRAARRLADVVIAPTPGPEVLAGSTRLKAGTATKLVLNTLTTASMTRLGKVYGNRMIDLQPRSRKLVERAVRLVSEIGGVTPARARRALADAGGRARIAIVMVQRRVPAREAERALRAAGGALRPVLTAPPVPDGAKSVAGPRRKR